MHETRPATSTSNHWPAHEITANVDEVKVGDALVQKSLQNLVKKLLGEGEEKDREKIITELKAKELETDPDILSEKALWYGRIALRSDENWRKQSISDAEMEDSQRKSDYKLIRYSHGLLDDNIKNEMKTEIRRARLDYLEKQHKQIEVALELNYVDKDEEFERFKRRMKAKGLLPEDA